jgi:uncharacterized SAM-binding protein YcdF (DUF218 family)
VKENTLDRRDVILVFGAAIRRSGKPSPVLRRRLEAAVEAGKRAKDPLYVVSGAAVGDAPAEAMVMRQTLLEHGVQDAAIQPDSLSRDTLEQARRFAAILDRLRTPGRVVVCTSGFHQPRCRLLLRMLGYASEGVPMPPERAAMGMRGWLYYVLRECAATVWDVVLLTCLTALGRGRLPAET